MKTGREKLHLAVLAALVAAASVSLSGCGLPPAIALAAYAADGISYATTGKSTTDHVLSAAADRDCALLRVAYNEEVCKKSAKNLREERDKRNVALAEYAAASDEVLPGLIVLDGDAPDGDQVAWSEPETPSPEAEMTLVEEPVDALLEPSGVVQTAQVEPASGVPGVGAPTPLLPQALRPTPLSRAEQLKSAPSFVELGPASVAKDERKMTVESWMLVLGSYEDELGASSAVRRFLAFRPEVVAATVSGRKYLRVVSGPYDAVALAAAKSRAREAGARDAWGVPLCRDDAAGTRCIPREAVAIPRLPRS